MLEICAHLWENKKIYSMDCLWIEKYSRNKLSKKFKYFLSHASEVQNTKLNIFENNKSNSFQLSTGGINVSFGLPDNKHGQGVNISLKTGCSQNAMF
jgi:hypothetical protein